jgi:hypothetical protein
VGEERAVYERNKKPGAKARLEEIETFALDSSENVES